MTWPDASRTRALCQPRPDDYRHCCRAGGAGRRNTGARRIWAGTTQHCRLAGYGEPAVAPPAGIVYRLVGSNIGRRVSCCPACCSYASTPATIGVKGAPRDPHGRFRPPGHRVPVAPPRADRHRARHPPGSPTVTLEITEGTRKGQQVSLRQVTRRVPGRRSQHRQIHALTSCTGLPAGRCAGGCRHGGERRTTSATPTPREKFPP